MESYNFLNDEETPQNKLFFEYRKYVSTIILALESVLYELIFNDDNLGLDILINDTHFNFNKIDNENEIKKFLFNYIARYFTEYINRLNEKNYNSVDREYIIEKETSNIYIIEDLINESYPLLVRDNICIDSKDTYLQDINEQLEYIIEQNKLLVIDKL
jgi:hypothetical protein